MHHAVTHCINFVEIAYASVLFAGKIIQNRLDGAHVVADVKVLLNFLTFVFEFDERIG